MDRLNFEGWSPIRIYREPGGELLVDWMRAPPEVTRTPFFADGVQNAMQWPFHQAFRRQTPLADLIGWAQASLGLQPSGIVFHVSRCGSTLVTQAFAALDDHVALSEPPPLDDLLRADHRLPGLDPAQALLATRAFASTWARPSPPGRHGHLVIKCDCWATALAGRISEAWPDTPWLFLYRDPLEVLVSQMQQRAAYLIPGGPLGVNPAGIPFDEALRMGPEAYCARSLGSIYAAMVREFRPDRTLLIDYRQLPAAIPGDIAPHFGMQPGAQAIERMQATFGVHAKNPSHPFTPDAGRKHREAPQRLRELAQEWIAPHYDALERLRTGQDSGAAANSVEAGARAEGATLP
ncbi:sulfotransferase family protein [Paracidovorax avenae]